MTWKDVFAIIGVIHTAVAAFAFCASIHAGYRGFSSEAFMRVPYAIGASLAGRAAE